MPAPVECDLTTDSARIANCSATCRREGIPVNYVEHKNAVLVLQHDIIVARILMRMQHALIHAVARLPSGNGKSASVR